MARILVVDDELHILKLVAFALEKAGHEVSSAKDGYAALSAARDETPELVLMDVMMPMMDGYETVERLRNDPSTAGIPVIMLSAKSQTHERRRGLDCGAARYICKPFTPKELVVQVNEFLESR